MATRETRLKAAGGNGARFQKLLAAETARAERAEENLKRNLGSLFFDHQEEVTVRPKKKARDAKGGKPAKKGPHGPGNHSSRVGFGGVDVQGVLLPGDMESLQPGDNPHRDGVLVDSFFAQGAGQELEESRVRGRGKDGAVVEEDSDEEDGKEGEGDSPALNRRAAMLELTQRRGGGDFTGSGKPLGMGRSPIRQVLSLHRSAGDATGRKSGIASGACLGGDQALVVRRSGEFVCIAFGGHVRHGRGHNAQNPMLWTLQRILELVCQIR